MVLWSKVGAYVASGWSEIWKFGMVGIATFGINFGAFSIFYGVLQHQYAIAASLAYAVTVVCHFLLNRFFTFGAGGQALSHNAPRYGLMLLLNYLITLLAQWFTVEVLRLSPYLGVVVATIGTAVTSFFLMKHFVFRQRLADA
jgi:putative flippase GtrA